MIEELHPVDRPSSSSSSSRHHHHHQHHHNASAVVIVGATTKCRHPSTATDAAAAAAELLDDEDNNAKNSAASKTSVAAAIAVQHPHYDDAELPNAFDAATVASVGVGRPLAPPIKPWRIRDRMKTVSVALVVCLNVGVDPPDVFKITPCARLECWIDPSSVSSQKAMEMIGINLQKQYERWQPRARYKQSLDPTNEDIKKLCSSLRRNAKEERVLFHYNGHGVPRPTVNGEIWVFNRTYTQYIPLSIYDLQQWIGAPSIYVYDCSNAGIIVNLFNQFAEQHEREQEQQQLTRTGGASAPSAGSTAGATAPGPAGPASGSPTSFKNCIQLAACAANQILPMNPALPADLFTSCLTTPIKTALKWFTLKQTAAMVPHVSYALIERIPGMLNDRRTMLGELNWIFTAITDTIAWNMLPRDLFQTLFRQDLLVASLFRNFLLADRIMRAYDCTPVSSPPLPACHRHPMWASWDLAVDLAVQQLPGMLEHQRPYQNSPFFEDQLSAFHVWLEQGCAERNPPEQLPIVLQVLLSQVHRLRALELLGRFLDLGPWAVHLALSVGIFPYVLKLLQASARELRPLLVFIWAKILAVDQTCQVDLICDQGHKYFLSVLQDATMSAEHRTLAAFVLASIVHGFPLGQTNALQGSLVSICLVQLTDRAPRLRQWLAICLGHLWQSYDKARWSGVRDLAHDKLYPLLVDPVPEVRAAAVYALGTFISSVTSAKDRTEHANNIDRSIAMELLTTVGNDMSPIVRMELIAAFQWMIILFENHFVSAFLQEPTAIGAAAAAGLPTAFRSLSLHHQHQQPQQQQPQQQHHQHTLQQQHSITSMGIGIGSSNSSSTNSLERNINMKRVSSSSSIAGMHFPSTTIIGFGSTYMKLWQGLIMLARDPHPTVAALAQRNIDFVVNQVADMIVAKEAAKENYAASGGLAGSMSLPPSPNTRVNYLCGGGIAESPPAHHINNTVNTPSPSAKMFASANGGVTSSSRRSTPMMSASASTAAARSRKNSRHAATDESDVEQSAAAAAEAAAQQQQKSQQQQKPIVTTDFIPWCVTQFSTPSTLMQSLHNPDTMPTVHHDHHHRHHQHHHHHHHQHHYSNNQQQQQAQQRDTVDASSSSTGGAFLCDDVASEDDTIDRHDPAYLRRIARFKRNEATRRLAREQKCRAIFNRLDTQSWSSRTQNVARLVRLHPFELQIAVAYKNKITVNDWTSNTIQAYVPSTATKSSGRTLSVAAAAAANESPVCTVDFINSHDRSLIMAGYDDGSVRIWRPLGNDEMPLGTATAAGSNLGSSAGADQTGEPHLITAWQAMNDIHSTGGKFNAHTNMVVAWQQRSQTVIVGGASKVLRCWDASTERKLADISTSSDANVTVLSSSGAIAASPSQLLAAGFADGSVRLYDGRLAGSSEALVRTFRETSGSILAACLRDDTEHLIVGCAQRSVRLYDIRRASVSMSHWFTDGEMQHMDVHRTADILACGSNNISVYGLDGRLLSTIRSHGFMGKTDSVACLAFHPLKVSLAAGFLDHTVAVYVSDSKRYAM